MKVKENLIPNDIDCNECKFCLENENCAVWGYGKPPVCEEFILKDCEIPSENYGEEL